MRGLIALSILLTMAAAQGNDCTPTPTRSSGTHFKPIKTRAIDVGKGLQVKGKILSATTCKPIPSAKIAHWQAGENGQYQDRLRAYLYSNQKGTYIFNTEWPTAFVPHIHFRVSVKGYKTLTTQWIGDERVGEITFNMVLVPDKRSQRHGRY